MHWTKYAVAQIIIIYISALADFCAGALPGTNGAS
jgi:hypothetical protein